MTRDIDLHVKSNGRGWMVLGSGDERPIATADTREDAVRLADHMRKANPGVRRIYIHDGDGTVHERTRLGHRDPFPQRKPR